MTAAESTKPQPQPTATGMDELIARADRATDASTAAIEKMRTRNDTLAKTLGGIGTTAAAGLSVTSIVKLAAWSRPAGYALLVAAGGTVLLLGGIWWLVVKFWQVNRPISIYTDLSSLPDDISDEERALISGVFLEQAALNGVPSLAAYQARGFRYQRIAATLPEGDPRRDDYIKRSVLIAAECRAVRAQAASRVLRLRSRRPLSSRRSLRSGWWGRGVGWLTSILPAAVALCGLVLVAVSPSLNDLPEVSPASRIKLTTDCASALKASAPYSSGKSLGKVCYGSDFRISPSPKPTPSRKVQKAPPRHRVKPGPTSRSPLPVNG